MLLLYSCGGSSNKEENFTLTTEITNLSFPTRLAELPSNKLLIAELASGELSIFNRQTKTKNVIANYPINLAKGIGISGLLVDSKFNENGFIFVYYGETNFNILVRLTLANDSVIKSEKLNSFIAPSGHNGGAMYQFKNGNILLGTGDGNKPKDTQILNNLSGKLILLSRNGEILNPNYSIGLRNPFGISGNDNALFVLDNGPDCDDEINLVIENANFGWRDDYNCGENNPLFSSPIFRWPSSEGTTDVLYSNNSTFSGKILAARYNSKTISVLIYNGQNINEERVLFSSGNHGQFIDILETTKGEILLASQDGNVYRIAN